MLTGILRVKVFEAPESVTVKENQDGDDLGVGKPYRLVAMPLAITDILFFCSDEKYLQKSSARQKNSVIFSSLIIAYFFCKFCN